MQVNPDQHVEYERRHRPIWQELEQTLKEHGVRNYSICLDAPPHTLFGNLPGGLNPARPTGGVNWNAIANTAVCQRGWKHMGDVMPSKPDDSPVSRELKEVFHID